MSKRSSYGQVNFRLSFDKDTPKEDIFLKSEELGVAINKVIKKHGAEIVSSNEFDNKVNYLKTHPDQAYGIGAVGGDAGDRLEMLKEWEDSGDKEEE